MSDSNDKQIVRTWQTPEGFASSNNGSTCAAVQTYSDGSVDIKSTLDPTETAITLTGGEWSALRSAIKDGQYDN